MSTESSAPAKRGEKVKKAGADSRPPVTDYSVCVSGMPEHAAAFLIGFAAGFAVTFMFYKIVLLSIICGAVFGVMNIYAAAQRAVSKRRAKLRAQFFDLLESVSVAMRAGSPLLKALQGARDDLLLIHAEESDIISELGIIIGKFNNAVPMSEAFSDFARRSKLDDIASFASVYEAVEGKSGRTDEIIRETQQIIADKMEIEMEIETLLAAAKSEANIMLLLPVVILGVIGYAGAGFMDSIYSTPTGRIVATVCLLIYIASYLLAQKISNVSL